MPRPLVTTILYFCSEGPMWGSWLSWLSISVCILSTYIPQPSRHGFAHGHLCIVSLSRNSVCLHSLQPLQSWWHYHCYEGGLLHSNFAGSEAHLTPPFLFLLMDLSGLDLLCSAHSVQCEDTRPKQVSYKVSECGGTKCPAPTYFFHCRITYRNFLHVGSCELGRVVL